jgi:ribitol-5-phosphate 2-dehydrogenase (NADP+) / D-ribitol-5-phosphate cytidylyltransferase
VIIARATQEKVNRRINSMNASTARWTPDRTVAIILAGGSGTRVGLDVPKQLLKIAGRTILEHTIQTLHRSPEIDEITIMMNPGHLDAVEALVLDGGYHKVTAVLPGGSTRNETTQLALGTLGDADCNVLLHDAVRPLLGERIIRECVNALRDYEAVDVAIPSADTIIEVRDDVIVDVPDRGKLRRGQTPQAFRLSTIRRAYELAAADPDFAATDDCTVVLRYLPDVPIRVVEGSDENMKITQPVDVFIADKLFQLSSRQVPQLTTHRAYSERLRGRTVVVFGGSSGIGSDVVDIARGYGATVFSYSRSSTGTFLERRGDVEAALAAAHEATGRIDHVVVTAGLLRRGQLVDMDDAAIDEAIAVNYLGPILIARAAAGYLARTRGSMLLYTSSSYTMGRAGYSLYSSAKAAIVNLTQALADEWSGRGVRINCINPERTATPMRTAAFGDEAPGTLLSSIHVARTSIDVLLSDFTGQTIDVRRLDPITVDVTRRTEPAGDGTSGDRRTAVGVAAR